MLKTYFSCNREQSWEPKHRSWIDWKDLGKGNAFTCQLKVELAIKQCH